MTDSGESEAREALDECKAERDKWFNRACALLAERDEWMTKYAYVESQLAHARRLIAENDR